MCVSDALGLPVQFLPREEVRGWPVSGMRGYGTFNLPPGTWSDDSSLTLCLAESLCSGYDLDDMAARFVQWYREGYWTPFGRAFDIGNTTSRAMERLVRGERPELSGDRDEGSNGNGSLMRILPLAVHAASLDINRRFSMAHQVSAITHAHPRAMLACGLYVQVAVNLLEGADPGQAVEQAGETAKTWYRREPFERELGRFSRILEGDVAGLEERDILSGGYVVHTLEAALWCLLNESSFAATVLRAVNLGEDTDTTGAVAGGLAGLFYGYEVVPGEWIDRLARKEEIHHLARRFARAAGGRPDV